MVGKSTLKPSNIYSPEEPDENILLNPYLSLNDENYKTNDIELIKSLQKEHIRNYGYLATYIVKTKQTVDKLYGEAIGSKFEYGFQIAIRINDMENFEDTGLLAEYGFADNDTITCFAPIDIMDREITKLNVENRLYPMPGDLIYVHLSKRLYEIRNVNSNVTSYSKNQNTLYQFFCQLYNQQRERFVVKTSDEKVNEDLNYIDKDLNEIFEVNSRDNEQLQQEVNEFKDEWQLNVNSGVFSK